MTVPDVTVACNVPRCDQQSIFSRYGMVGGRYRHYQAARMNRPPQPKRRPASVTPRTGPSYIRGGKGV